MGQRLGTKKAQTNVPGSMCYHVKCRGGFAAAGWRPPWLRPCPWLPRMYCRQIEAVNATQYCQGVPSKIHRVWMKANKTGMRFNGPATNLAIWHTMTNSSRKQQHCCCSNNTIIATHRAAAAAAAALCMHMKLTSILLRRHPNHHRTYIYTGNKIHGANKKKVKLAHTQKNGPSEIRTADPQIAQTATYPLPHYLSCAHRPSVVCIYTY